jgi:cell wall-associated NlpC family hydrolase
VGIYLDDGRFVHAPATGKRVEIASLGRGWYQRNFIRAGRLPSSSGP